MFDTKTGTLERIREEGAVLHDRSMDRRQRRLQHNVEALHDELERERAARRALIDAMGNTGHGKRRHSVLRVLVIGGGAYILGTRAGRERYDQMIGWVRGLRDRVTTTARDVQDEAAQTVGQVRDVALDTARNVREDVKSTATQVRTEAADGARQVGEETTDGVGRLKKALAPANDAADV